jgi:hypothetical protein
LVQKAVDRLQVNVVCHPAYDESSQRAFRQHLAEFFGPKMRFTFNRVDEIPATTSGKKRFSISELESNSS